MTHKTGSMVQKLWKKGRIDQKKKKWVMGAEASKHKPEGKTLDWTENWARKKKKDGFIGQRREAP